MGAMTEVYEKHHYSTIAFEAGIDITTLGIHGPMEKGCFLPMFMKLLDFSQREFLK